MRSTATRKPKKSILLRSVPRRGGPEGRDTKRAILYTTGLLALCMFAVPMVAAENGPEHPDNDHDNDDSAPAPTTTTAVATSAVPGDSSFARSQGSTSTFDQSVSIPADNVIAALALSHGGFGRPISVWDIANVHQAGSFSSFANQNVGLSSNDVLLALALGNRGFGTSSLFGVSPFFGTGFGSPVFVHSFGSPFVGSGFHTCFGTAHDRLLAWELGLRSTWAC